MSTYDIKKRVLKYIPIVKKIQNLKRWNLKMGISFVIQSTSRSKFHSKRRKFYPNIEASSSNITIVSLIKKLFVFWYHAALDQIFTPLICKIQYAIRLLLSPAWLSHNQMEIKTQLLRWIQNIIELFTDSIIFLPIVQKE